MSFLANARSWLSALSESDAQNIARRIDAEGFFCLPSFLTEEDLRGLRSFVASAIASAGHQTVSLNRDQLTGTGLDVLADLAQFRAPPSLLHRIWRAGARGSLPSGLALPDGRKRLEAFLVIPLRFHAITALVPVEIPAHGQRGDFLIIPSTRGIRGNYFFNLVDKVILDNWATQRLLRTRFVEEKRIKRVPMVPDNLYLFWGYRSIHTNEPVDAGAVRATALFHYADPHAGSVMKRRLGRGQRPPVRSACLSGRHRGGFRSLRKGGKIDLHGLASYAIDRKMFYAHLAAFPPHANLLGTRQKIAESSGQCLRVPGRNQNSGSAEFQQLRNAVDIGPDDRASRFACLGKDEWRWVGMRRQNENVRSRHQGKGVVDGTDESNGLSTSCIGGQLPVGGLEGAAACDIQTRLRVSRMCETEGLQEIGQTLAGVKPADEKDAGMRKVRGRTVAPFEPCRSDRPVEDNPQFALRHAATPHGSPDCLADGNDARAKAHQASAFLEFVVHRRDQGNGAYLA
jgi:hypothetical protein